MIRIVTSLVLLAAVWLSLSALGGSLVHRMVQQELGGRGDVAGAIDRLQFAMQLDSRNPDTLALLAGLQAPDEAIGTYRQLSTLAPRDPLVWAQLYAVKLQLRQLDAETVDAFEQAVRLGPYEPRVLETLIESGSRHWLMLDSGMRQQIIDSGVRALENRAPFRKSQISRTLADRGLLGLICAAPNLENYAECKGFGRS